MAHGAGGGARDALEGLNRNHHHGHPAVAPAAAEMGRQIGGCLEIFVGRHSFGSLEHHMATWQFLGMEPKVAAAGLLKRNPLVLAVVAAHLHGQAPEALHLQGLGLGLLPQFPITATG